MYLGSLGQGSTGERFRIIASGKGGRVTCPPGTTQESSGKLGTGQPYAWCYRPPVFAPPPVTTISYEAPRTTVQVPTAISTQVSPQISPTLAQQQASPGATVAAAPQQVAAGPIAAPSAQTGISAQDMMDFMRAQDERAARERALAEQRRRDEKIASDRAAHEAAGAIAEQRAVERQLALDTQRAAEAQRTAEDRARAAEFENLQRTLIERDAPDLRIVATDMINGAGPTMAEGGFVPPQFDVAAALAMPGPVGPPGAPGAPEPAPGAPGAAPGDEAGPPWALILLAAAGVGAVVLMGGKKGGKTRTRKRIKK